MIETIRINKEYPTYANMLMPAEKWEHERGYNDWRWAFATTEYYAALYNPRVSGAWWDFTDDSLNASKAVMQTGVLLLERAYELKIGEERTNDSFEKTVEDFFSDADEYFIGPTGAEELLRNMIQRSVDLRKYMEAIK